MTTTVPDSNSITGFPWMDLSKIDPWKAGYVCSSTQLYYV